MRFEYSLTLNMFERIPSNDSEGEYHGSVDFLRYVKAET